MELPPKDLELFAVILGRSSVRRVWKALVGNFTSAQQLMSAEAKGYDQLRIPNLDLMQQELLRARSVGGNMRRPISPRRAFHGIREDNLPEDV